MNMALLAAMTCQLFTFSHDDISRVHLVLVGFVADVFISSVTDSPAWLCGWLGHLPRGYLN